MNLSYHPEHGGAIFYILFAIAMITALTFALNRGSQMSGDSLTKDRARLAAQEVIAFAQSVAGTVDKLKLRGFTDNHISFENNINTNYNNANCLQNACKVFSIGGGNLNYSPPNVGWLDRAQSGEDFYGQWLFTGNLNVVGTQSSTTDLLLILPYVSQQVCEIINTTLNVSAPTVVDSYSGTVGYFNGTAGGYTAAATPDIGNTATAYSGKNAFCFQSASGVYTFAQVLISR